MPDGMTAVPVPRQQLALITCPGDGSKDRQIELRAGLSRDLVPDSGRRVAAGAELPSDLEALDALIMSK